LRISHFPSVLSLAGDTIYIANKIRFYYDYFLIIKAVRLQPVRGGLLKTEVKMKSASPFQRANLLSVCMLALVMLFSCEQLAQAAHVTITTQPHDTNVLAGSNATFTVVAGGTAPLRYRWRFNGTNLTNGGRISGATNATLSISNVATGDAGGYRVVVSNVTSVVTSVVATLTVLLPPSITTQPTNQSVPINSNVTFYAAAAGTGPLLCQWQKDGTNLANDGRISGATNSALTVSGIQASDAGDYRMIVTNACGAVTSSVATLTVLFPPGIVASPANQRVLEGHSATFSVTAAGTEPLFYHWQKEGLDLSESDRLSGVTNATLTISNLQFSDAGAYRAVVSNAYGAATSAVATLTVATNLPPLSGSIGVWGDYDNDGLMDVLLAGTVQGVTNIPDGRFTRIYHNEGSGIFTDSGAALPQLDNAAAAWGDFDNDGDLDLLLSGLADGTNGPVAVTEVYRNDGSNHFTAINAGLEGLAQGSVAWVDYDNDGRPDVFVNGLQTASTNWISRLYHNNGNGTFSLVVTNLPTPQNARGYWADYDNDGYVDLLQAGSDATYLLRNDGAGGFTNASVSIPSQHRVISPWGDFAGDGDLDFMTSSGTYPSVIFGPDYHPGITRNDGSGGLSSSLDYSLDMWLFSANWGDIDNSGRACVVVSGWVPLVPGGGVWGSATKVYIYLGSSWQEVFTLGGWDSFAETWVDYDGDGALDIFTTGGGYTMFWHNNVAFHRDFPQPPLNPTVAFRALDAVTLSWLSPSNTPSTGRGLTYNVRVGRVAGGVDVVSPLADPATGRRLIQTAGNAGTAHVFKLNNLPPGNYYWSVQSIGQSFTGSPFAAEGTFTVTSSPPVVVTQPTNLSVLSDATAVFAAAVIGTKPLVYQWRKDGVPLSDNGIFSGSAGPTLTVSNAQPPQTGAYDLVITNSYGSVTSVVATLTVHGEPRILRQPASVYVPLTRSASFSVTAAGTLPLSYQWYLGSAPLADGARLSGTASPSLTVQNIQTGDAGGYSVVVSNAWGSITSSVAMLNLATPRYVNVNNTTPSAPYTSWATAATVIQDAIDAANVGDWIFVTNGVYQTGGRVVQGTRWNRVVMTNQVTVIAVNGPRVTTILGDIPPNHHTYGTRCVWLGSGSTLSGFTISGGGNYLGNYQSGLYDDSGGGIRCESSSALVTGCIISGNSGCEDGGGVFSGTLVNCLLTANTAHTYSQGTIYYWGMGGGAYFSTLLNCTVVTNSAISIFNFGGGLAYSTATNCIVYYNSGGDGFNAGFVNSCSTGLQGGSGNITNEPLFLDLAGGNFRLQSNSPCINAGMNVPAVGNADLDGFPRVVDGIVDMGAHEYQHLPCILVPPASQSILVFSNVLFTVSALGDEPLAYQWQKDGVNLSDDLRISGATTPFLSISNLLVADAGGYRVIVTNASGSVTSAVATLTLLGPPSISGQPVSRTVSAGTNISFNVTASGLAALSYQWRFNQAELPAKTNASLSLTNVQSANAGNYDVVITNFYGAITSSVATLTVLPAAPTITTQAVSRVVSVGQAVSLTVTARGTEPMACQWQFNGADLPGANSFTLILDKVNASFTGTYRAAVSNAVGVAFTTNLTLTISPVVMWGLTNLGQVEPGAGITIPAAATNVVAIAAGGDGNLGLPCMVLRGDGTLARWGVSSRDLAVPSNAVDVVAMSIGGESKSGNYLALRTNGTLVHWTASSIPSVPAALTNGNIVAVAAGAAHQLALRDDGTVFAWGSNSSGQTNMPPGATNVIAIAAGLSHSLALRADGVVVGWGLNTSGQATALSNFVNVVAIVAGGNQSLGLLADGTVVGRIVTNTPGASVNYGPPAGNTTNKIAIAAGIYHSLAVGTDRTINGWGATNYGQIAVPAYATNVLAIAAGGNDSLALVRDPFAPPIPPRIGRPPLGRALKAGDNVVFNALAVGGLPLRYQWLRDGSPVAGQTNQTLTLTNAHPSEAGDYQLVAMNDFGSTTSAVATVTISIPPPILTSTGMVTNGFRFSFTGIARVIYVVEYKDNLSAGVWTELERRFGMGGWEIITDTSANGAMRFYRVRALYAPSPKLAAATWSGGSVNFSFATVAGAQYVVEYTDQLAPPQWHELQTIPGTGSSVGFADPAPVGPQRFYRLRVR
jgi:hypothetical protein